MLSGRQKDFLHSGRAKKTKEITHFWAFIYLSTRHHLPIVLDCIAVIIRKLLLREGVLL